MGICKRSDKANLVIQFILLKLCPNGCGPIDMIECCFDTAIEHYGYEKPDESKLEVCEFVKDMFNSINNNAIL